MNAINCNRKILSMNYLKESLFIVVLMRLIINYLIIYTIINTIIIKNFYLFNKIISKFNRMQSLLYLCNNLGRHKRFLGRHYVHLPEHFSNKYIKYISFNFFKEFSSIKSLLFYYQP